MHYSQNTPVPQIHSSFHSPQVFAEALPTFSTFANESLQMLQNGNIGGFITYILLSLIALGYWIIK